MASIAAGASQEDGLSVTLPRTQRGADLLFSKSTLGHASLRCHVDTRGATAFRKRHPNM